MSTAPSALRVPAVLAASVMLALGVAACGSASSTSTSAAAPRATTTPGSKPEVSPAGDIPDNQAYVPYVVPGTGLSVNVPEGWSRSAASGATTFTDKLNAIGVETAKRATAPSVASVKQDDVRKLAALPGYHAGTVTSVRRTPGTAIRVTYLADAAADAVTGKTRIDAFERYLFFHRGRVAVLTLSGPKGADNVDPWRLVTDSVRWTR
jgi:hypothetical protein